MKKLLTIVLLSMCVSCVSFQISEEEKIRAKYQAFAEAFMAKDEELTALHFSVPAMLKPAEGAELMVMSSIEDLENLFSMAFQNLSEGYKYSTIDRLDVHRVQDSLYYVIVDYTRFNDQDEVVNSGSSLYFFSNSSGEWMIFYGAPANR